MYYLSRAVLFRSTANRTITLEELTRTVKVREAKQMMFLLSLEEGDVEDGRVEIHELEHKHFECQTVFVLSLCSMHF